MNEITLTLKQLVEKTNCPPYIIKYLHDCKRLPVFRESSGAGYPILYEPEAVDIIKTHVAKSTSNIQG
ncbi:MAG: hypothetical protein HQ510_12730 [Candidatus Marinimicrobia bacterium]|nr:hypothetical protein [Candidatus Neomarinimicrobiota bacterium]